jgi:hypothetical protein
MEFKASMDKMAKGITVFVTVLFAIIMFGQYPFIRPGDGPAPLVIDIILIVVYVLVYLYRPVKYSVGKDFVVIHRLAGNVKIERKKISTVEIPEKGSLKGAIRSFGVGGLFGYFGYFYKFKIGKMIWYATRLDKMVLISMLDNKKIVVSPDEAERFMAALEK